MKTRQKRHFRIRAIISSLPGVLLILFGVCFRFKPLIGFGLLYFFIVILVLGIIALVVSFRSRAFIGKNLSILAILILGVLALLHFRYLVLRSFPYLCTPPALTTKNIPIFNECIDFLKNHDEYKDLNIFHRGLLSVDPETFLVVSPVSLNDIFSEDEISKIENFVVQFRRIQFDKLRRVDDMVLFYRASESLFPYYYEEIYSLGLNGPGVLYSLSGRNPNEIDNDVIDAAKPFTAITGNWFMSRKLVLAGLRSDISMFTPKSLIDHSLRLDEIDPNELTRFD